MAKTLAAAFGVILLLLGLVGFVSNPLVGANALFEANNAMNWLHLLLGAAMFIALKVSADAA